MRFSVSIQAEGDREVTLEEVVDLADAVATLEGIASGYGTMGYGAQIIVEADISDIAAEIALTTLAIWRVNYSDSAWQPSRLRF